MTSATLRNLVLVLLLPAVLPVGVAQAQTTVTLTPSRDNTLIERAAGDLSNATGTAIVAGRTNQPIEFRRRALLAFDVAGSIPAGATVQSATLTLEMTLTIAGPETMDLHRVLADWGEGTSQDLGNGGRGVAASAGDATWTERFFGAGQPWATAGGDFAATASTSATVDNNGSYTWPSSASTVADVQAWLDNPAGNFGWILIGNESAAPSAKRFDSREGATPPQLTVTYVGGAAPTAVPTASTWALVALALLLAAGAMRRLSVLG